MNANILKGKMRELEMSQEDVAAEIGISRSALNAKLNGTRGAEFTLGEVKGLRKLLALSPEQVEQIFFA